MKLKNLFKGKRYKAWKEFRDADKTYAGLQRLDPSFGR